MTRSLDRVDRGQGVATLAAFLGACAFNTGTVVLLPEKAGLDAAVSIRHGDREVVLDKPYAAARVSPFGPHAYTASAQEVEARFGAALAAQPSRATTFTLYFVFGEDEFTPESKELFESVFGEIAKRPTPDIVVVGHTDRMGTDEVNDALALRRAGTVRAELVRRGIAPENIVAVGRGKREPLAIPTADGVAEPRNRRVEIVVR
jgi:outer membrane protein OmpA-like peptidoglycan-associated protein